ncbi:MAG: HAD family hydrolase [Nitrosospira sp.]|jgi:HAD superfamily hydrolase (TIGR01490 family)|nr:HAD family hydrolase [Nitrosospira sp.]MDW7642633.1 HAD family hydrolase [Nitrosomonadaceae bacterium]MBI0408289.1 HAD family hydrolase [Nitrosospira sp.]MBI0414362.1 HAD family hydrolase [Nitrosospira sp.]MBI0415444.1 HAD family hydrolase [Nitrosospira sp.]
MNLALFDLDNTLLIGDSDFEWAQFLIERHILDREKYEARNLEFYKQYRAGTLDIHKFLSFQLKPLSHHPRSQLDIWHHEFMEEKITQLIAPGARELIDKHKLAGDLCIIITATNYFVTAPIVRMLGIDHLIATEPEQKNGEFTGHVSGIPCFQEGKVTRLEQWLDEHNLTWLSFLNSWFYSDSLNDLPLLNKVTKPVAVNPDPTLRDHAQKNNWPIINLR